MDIMDISSQQIINRDCIEGMKELDDNSVDIIICDPPYNIGKDFGNNSDKQSMDDYLVWCDSWITECIRILKPKGSLFIYGFSEILSFIRVKISINVRWLIWHYTNKNTKLPNPDLDTHEIEDFCLDCSYCTDKNKKKRKTFIYKCNGHEI